jgi:hypothetical protein
LELFSNWENVESKMEDFASDPPTETNIPKEIQEAFDFVSPHLDHFNLIVAWCIIIMAPIVV